MILFSFGIVIFGICGLAWIVWFKCLFCFRFANAPNHYTCKKHEDLFVETSFSEDDHFEG